MYMTEKEYNDKMFNCCKTAHEHKDKLIMMMIEHEENGAEIPMEMKIDYLVNRAICHDNMNEVTRKNVWQPVNKKMREADGIHTVFVDDKSHFITDLKGHDLTKAMAHVLRHMDIMKTTDPVKYNAMIAEIKA